MKYDVLIIGAGSTGASLARRLSRFQLKVAMLEKENDVAMGTGKANTAIVHGGYAESGKELRGRLCLPGRKKLKKLNNELHFGLRTNGSLVLAFEEEELPALKQLYQQGLENGLTDMELVGREKLRELEPAVHPDAKYALYCSGAGILSPYEYIIALCENAVYNGVRLFLNTEVTGIMGDRDQGFQIQALQGGKKVAFESSFVVNAAGLAGAGVTNMVQEADFTIHPRSGQFLLFQKGTGSRIHHSLFQVPTPKSKGILVAQTYHNNMLLGPDAVDEKEARWDTDIDRLLAIYHGAQRSVQEGIIPEKQLIRTFTGLRPVSSMGDFIIGKTRVLGFLQAVGIQSPGLTSSPVIGEMLEDLLREEGLEAKEDPHYNPIRKPIIQYKELEDFNKIRDRLDLPLGDPHRIVCRCEQVDEKTIRDCLHRSVAPTTIDGVKRRTRTGMGFCQGSFCRKRVQEVMEAELGHAIDPRFDIEVKGIHRVEKKEFLATLEEEKASDR